MRTNEDLCYFFFSILPSGGQFAVARAKECWSTIALDVYLSNCTCLGSLILINLFTVCLIYFSVFWWTWLERECLEIRRRTYAHSYDDAVVSGAEAGAVLEAKVSGLKMKLLAKFNLLLFWKIKGRHGRNVCYQHFIPLATFLCFVNCFTFLGFYMEINTK